MLHNKNIIAIIPARGNSKRIPGKNLIKVNGTSLVDRAIECAISNDRIHQTIVSSEDLNVLQKSNKHSQVIYHNRPPSLSKDNTLTSEVVLNIIENYNLKNCWILILQPSSPFRTSNDLKNFLNTLAGTKIKFDSAVSLTPLKGTHPDKVQVLNGDFVESYLGKDSSVPTQGLPEVFELNGFFYLTNINFFKKKKKFIGERCVPFIMEQTRSLNLDTQDDLILMEHYLKSGKIDIRVYKNEN